MRLTAKNWTEHLHWTKESCREDSRQVGITDPTVEVNAMTNFQRHKDIVLTLIPKTNIEREEI